MFDDVMLADSTGAGAGPGIGIGAGTKGGKMDGAASALRPLMVARKPSSATAPTATKGFMLPSQESGSRERMLFSTDHRSHLGWVHTA